MKAPWKRRRPCSSVTSCNRAQNNRRGWRLGRGPGAFTLKTAPPTQDEAFEGLGQRAWGRGPGAEGQGHMSHGATQAWDSSAGLVSWREHRTASQREGDTARHAAGLVLRAARQGQRRKQRCVCHTPCTSTAELSNVRSGGIEMRWQLAGGMPAAERTATARARWHSAPVSHADGAVLAAPSSASTGAWLRGCLPPSRPRACPPCTPPQSAHSSAVLSAVQ